MTLAVEELNIDHKHEEIDLMNKPSWYAERINPASKVRCVVAPPQRRS